ncbi:MAG: ectoine/hydroxyectoine ABC transporter permease subunit EhuC [Micromonosporaceae bacterium]
MVNIGTALGVILEGFWITVAVTVGGAVLALVVSFLAGLAALSPNPAIRGVNRVFVEFFRGTSLLVQLFWWFYVLPFLGVQLHPIAAGIVALGINYGAYGSEVVRGAILAVPRTQREATVALSMTPLQRMRLVLLPQAIVGMIPPFTNLLIQLLKGSALVYLIALADLSYQAKEYRDSTGDTFLAYGLVLVVYFLLAQAMALGMRYWERRAKANIGQAPPPVFKRLVTVPASTAGGAGIGAQT